MLSFEATSATALMVKLLTQEAVPPIALNAEIPPALSALIMRLLAKAPEERVQTAAELSEQLTALG